MSLHSALYVGHAGHLRRTPSEHRFRFPLFMLYLDLDELDRVFCGRWFWSARRAAVARFHREDHLGPVQCPLSEAVRDLVKARGGTRPTGPVRLLTQLRYFGFVFNPVSFYYCFDDSGESVVAIVAEVNNTPWNESHCYVLSSNETEAQTDPQRFRTAKAFHVSPFMGMDVSYLWTFGRPGGTLRVQIENEHPTGESFFSADLDLRRREIGGRSLARMLLRYPAMTLQVIAGIYWQALRLRRKGVPYHPHPRDLDVEIVHEVAV